jgi:hypothetical protein
MLEDDAPEPPPPPGLGSLSASLKAFADFLRIDPDLIEVVAERSPRMAEAGPSRSELEAWIGRLPDPEKNAILLRLVETGEPHLRAELLQRFRQASTAASRPSAEDGAGRRTVGQLLAAAEERAEARRREEAARRAEERARRKQEEAAAREKHLDGLVGREEEIWSRVGALVETKKPTEYDQAVRLLADLRDLAARAGVSEGFAMRILDLREQHARKPSLLKRLDQAGL